MLVYAIVVALVVFVRVFYSYTRLWPIPGPAYACVSGLWRGYAQRSPDYSRRLRKMHERYGRVVRIGPNTVSVSDPVAITRMYGRSMDEEKVFTIENHLGQKMN